jgi:subtilisin-like proprotein convertase family protein
VATTLSAQVISTNSYTGASATISDGNLVGVMEQFNVSGLTGSIYDVQVSLGITGGFNGDLYAYLVGPEGQLAVLLNRVGVAGTAAAGYSEAGMNVTLDGLATVNIHDYGTVSGYSLDGTVWAADGRNVDPQTDGATLYATPPTANLGVFANTSANGLWTLYIADVSPGGGAEYLNSVGLTILTVPEPQTWGLLAGGLLALGWRWKRRCAQR